MTVTVWQYRLPPYPRVDGAQLRVEQNAEFLRAQGFRVESLITPTLRSMKTVSAAMSSAVWSSYRKKGADHLMLRSTLRLVSALNAAPVREGDVIWHDCAGEVLTPSAVMEMHKRGLRVIAAPHNIQTLTLAPRSAAQFAGLRSEMTGLRQADALVAISQADSFLVQLFGGQCVVLPYFPPSEKRAQLATIRAKRRETFKSLILILGTASNPPTAQGMQAQMDFVRRASNQCGDIQFVVAGKATDQFAAQAPPNVRVMGRVSDDELAGLLHEARALWVQHPPTTGALTRVVEAQLMGLPVILNAATMHDDRAQPGIAIYQDDRALLRWLRDPPEAPMAPEPPRLDLGAILSGVQAMC